MNAIETFVEKLIDGGQSYEAIYVAITRHSSLVVRDLIRENYRNLDSLDELQQKHAKHILANMPSTLQ